MTFSKIVIVTLKDGFKFEALLKETDKGWEAFVPHTGNTGYGFSQKEAIVDALNESTAGL